MRPTDVPGWTPAFETAPLENFTHDADKVIRLAELAWSTPEHPDGIVLDLWQKHLLQRILETKNGRLRFRQVLVSIPRQNSKSTIAAILALYGLLFAGPGGLVIGVASTLDQARIIYDRTLFAIQNNPALRKKFSKTTDTRGVRTNTGAVYEIKPSKSASTQGLPVSMGILDEVHLTKKEVFQAMVFGTTSRESGIVVAVTTAGDEDSSLLKDLYEQGKASLDDPETTFGTFIWEAPQGCRVDDPDAITISNPAVACGRIPLDRVIADIRAVPELDARRYRLNQFVKSKSASWLPQAAWARTKANGVPTDYTGHIWTSIDIGTSWETATVVRTAKIDDDIYTELVQSIANPTMDQLVNLCRELYTLGPTSFVLDHVNGTDLAKKLRQYGFEVFALGYGEMADACATAYAEIVREHVRSDGDPQIAHQIAAAVRKNSGDAWKLSRNNSPIQIDGAMATVIGIYASARKEPMGIQLFV